MYLEIINDDFEHPKTKGEFHITIYLSITNASQPFNLIMTIWDENIAMAQNYALRNLNECVDKAFDFAKEFYRSPDGITFPTTDLASWLGDKIASAMNKTGGLD